MYSSDVPDVEELPADVVPSADAVTAMSVAIAAIQERFMDLCLWLRCRPSTCPVARYVTSLFESRILSTRGVRSTTKRDLQAMTPGQLGPGLADCSAVMARQPEPKADLPRFVEAGQICLILVGRTGLEPVTPTVSR